MTSVLSPYQSQMFGGESHDAPQTAPSAQGQDYQTTPQFQAFLARQRAIQAQPAPALPKRYSDGFYKGADDSAYGHCISRITSPDWRLRNISIIASEALKDLIDEVVRMPIIHASREAFTAKGQPTEPRFVLRFPHSMIPEESQQRQFVRINDGKPDDLAIYVPLSKIKDVVQRCNSFLGHGTQQEPGFLLSIDLIDRAFNVFFRYFQPEAKCFEWFEATTGQRVSKPGSGNSLALGFACEVFRRMRIAGFDWNLTEAFLEPRFKIQPNHPVFKCVAQGATLDRAQQTTW